MAVDQTTHQPPQRVMIVMSLATQKGGGELMLIHLMQQQAITGIEWFVVFLEDGPMVQAVRDLGVQAFVVPAGRLRQPIKMLGTIRTIARLARENKIDLMFGWMGKAHLYGGPAALRNRCTAMWYQLGTPSRKSILEWLMNLVPARAIITCGPESQVEQAKFIPSRPGKLVPPGVELDRFDPAKIPSKEDARYELGLTGSGPFVGIVGRMQHWKGIHVLIGAMPEILKKYPAAQAIVVGGTHDLEADYPAKLSAQIAELGLAKSINCVGLQKNVPTWVAAFDIFVHASDREPFGIVVLEAMAMNKPVVAGSEGGPKMVITDGVNGQLTRFGDSAALARAVLRYLDHPDEAKAIADRGRLRAHDFSVPAYAKNLAAAIREMAG